MNEQWDDAFCRVAIARRYLTTGQAESLLRDSADARDNNLTFDFTEAAVLRGLLAQQHVNEVVELLAFEPTKGEVDHLAGQLIERGYAPEGMVRGVVERWKFDKDLAGDTSPSLSEVLVQAHVATHQQIAAILAEVRPAGVPFVPRGPAVSPQAVFDAVTQVVPADRPVRSYPTPPAMRPPGARSGTPTPPPPTRPPSRTPTPRPPSRTATPRAFPAPPARPQGTHPGTSPRNPDVGRVLRVRDSMGGGMGAAIAGVSVLVITLIVYFVAKSDRSDPMPSRPPQVASAHPEPELEPAPRRDPVHPVDPNREKPTPPDPAVEPPPKPPQEAPKPAPRVPASPVFALLEQAAAMEDNENAAEAARLLEEASGVPGISARCRTSLEEERRLLSTRGESLRKGRDRELGGDLDAARSLYLAAFSCDAISFAALAAAAQGPADQAAARQCLERRFRHLVRTGIEARADLRLVESLTAYDVALTLHKRMGMTCDASGPRDSRNELARRLRNLITLDGEGAAEAAVGPGGVEEPLGPSPSPPVDAVPPPAVDPPPTRNPAPPPSGDETVPGLADLPAELRGQLDEMTGIMLSLWADRANPTNNLEEHRGEVLRFDLALKRMKKEDQERPAVSFVEGVTHFLLYRGLFEEFLAKRRAARTKPELKRVIDSYEPLYRKELSSAQTALKKARKAHSGHFAACLFEDLSRAWATDEWGAKKGTDDAQKDLVALRPATAFDRELESYCLENGLPKK